MWHQYDFRRPSFLQEYITCISRLVSCPHRQDVEENTVCYHIVFARCLMLVSIALLALAVAPFATALSLHDPTSPVPDVIRITWITEASRRPIHKYILKILSFRLNLFRTLIRVMWTRDDLVLEPAVHKNYNWQMLNVQLAGKTKLKTKKPILRIK